MIGVWTTTTDVQISWYRHRYSVGGFYRSQCQVYEK